MRISDWSSDVCSSDLRNKSSNPVFPARSALRSPARLLLDLQLDNQIFLRRAIAHPANRRGIAIVEPRRDPDVTPVGRMAVADVEADPADMVEMRFGPAVRRIQMRPFVHHQIARDAARCVPHMAHRRSLEDRRVGTEWISKRR